MKADNQQQEKALLNIELYQSLFEQSPDGILVTDLDGNLLECNKAAYQALGYSKEEFEQLDLAALNTLPDPRQALTHHRKIISDDRTEFEARQKAKDGATRDVLVTIQKLILTGHTLLHITWHDISDCTRVKRELTESLRGLELEKTKTEAIIHAIGDGVSIRDLDYRIMYQNQIMIDYTGDLTGELCYQAIHGLEQICDGCPVALSYQDGQVHTAELTTPTKRGLQYFESTASPIRDATDKIVGAIELIRNTTAKKRAEQALQAANVRMEALLNAIPDMVLFKDAQRRWLVVNKAVEEANGLSREEMLGKVDEDFAPPEVAAMCRASDEKAMNSDSPVHSEESVVGAAGETIYLDTIKAPMHDEQGNLAGLVVVSRDITERKKAEEALRLSSQRLLKAQQMAHVGNWEWTLGKDELYWSDEIYRIYGRDPENFTPTFTEFQKTLHPDDLDHLLQALDAALNHGKPFDMDYRMIRYDGTERTIHTIGEVVYDQGGVALGMTGTLQDITERKRLEAKAWEQYATLESILESTDNPIYSVDHGYRYTSFNQRHAAAMQEIYGVEIELGKSILDFIPEAADRRQAKLGLDRALSGENVILEDSFGTDKKVRLYEAAYNPIRDMNGKVLGVSLYARDTTERRQAEEQLKASEKRLRDITANLGVGLYVLDEQGKITFINPMAEQLWGWTLEELQERGAHDLVHYRKLDGTSLPLEECEIMGVINKGLPYSSMDEFFVRKDGTVFPVSVIATPLFEEGRVVASVTAFRDITAEKRLEEEQLKIQKLESVGILAGGIAHDFNNLLQVIMGSVSLAIFNLDRDLAAIPSLLKQAEEASKAAKELSFRLLTFAKGGAPVKTTVSIEDIVRKSTSLSLSGSSIDCDIELSPDLPAIAVDGGQMMQVFNNIFINAKDAMPQGGTIKIRANNVAIRGNSPLPLKKGKYLHISIQDNGCGIPASNLSKIFDPYFSMKEMGSNKGSGLGLSICMAIVRKHDGHISVESRLGQGTTFHIYIPSSSAALPIHKPEVKSQPAMSSKRVLFMDDDERVRQLVGNIITSLGCEVECARHGEEAMELYKLAIATGKPFAGVILDLTVKGGMGGDKLVTGLRQIDPQVKAVIASGYVDNPIMKGFREYGFMGALSKPFSINQLEKLLATF